MSSSGKRGARRRRDDATSDAVAFGGNAPRAWRDELAMQRFLRYEAARDHSRRDRERLDKQNMYPRNGAAGQWAMSREARPPAHAPPCPAREQELEAYPVLLVPTKEQVTGEHSLPPALRPENRALHVPPPMCLSAIASITFEDTAARASVS